MKKALIFLVLLLILAATPLAASTKALAAELNGGIGYFEDISPATSPSATQGASPGSSNNPSSQDINPLTGLSVTDASLLTLPPALVSVSNFPVTARPQAGLSFSPYVFEMYIGEGMTRFLAMFYGNFPAKAIAQNSSSSKTPSDTAGIGPIRSGRLPYESIRKLYSGFLVMASASPEVGAALKSTNNVFNPSDNDINGAMVDVTRLQSFAEATAKTKKSFNLTGNSFSPTVPGGGSQADILQVFYNFWNQVKWTYDPATGAYLRFQDKADGSGNFYPANDRLTGKQLAFDNVIVLYAKHTVENRAGTLIDIDLLYTGGKAYLFRDGQVFPIKWSTANGDYERTTGLLRPIRFLDQAGNAIQLKPGNTWVEVVDVTTLTEQAQPGLWKVRFFAP